MQLKINRTEFLSKLNTAKAVVASKSPLPILDCVKINNESITASDGENTIIMPLNIANDDRFEFCVNARTLTDAISKIKDDDVALNLTDVNLTVRYKRGKITIPTQDASDYPLIATPSQYNELSINTKILQDMVSRASKMCADDELRPVMNGVFIESRNGSINVVASDGHRLFAEKTVSSTDEGFSFILNKKAASIFTKLPNSGDCKILVDERNSVIDVDGISLYSRLIEGRYPNWESVIPKENPHKVVVNRKELIETLNRLSISANASGVCKLSFTDGNSVCVSTQDIDFSLSASETLDITAEPFKMDIGFKLTFLKSLLENEETENVALSLKSESVAGLITPVCENNNIIQLLMPMML